MAEKEKENQNVAELTMPLPTDRLLLGFRIPFKVYIKKDRDLVPLFNNWTMFDQKTKDILNDRGITTVYIEGTPSKIEDYLSDVSKVQPESLDKKKFYEYSLKKENYLTIDKTLVVDRNLFVKDTHINFSIFVISDMLFEELVHATIEEPAEIPYTVFKTRGDFAVKITDIPLYKEYLNTILASPDIPENLRQKSRTISIKENSKMLVRDVLSNPVAWEKMDELSSAIGEITDSVLNKEVSVYDLMSLKSHDLYTYTHSVNVAVMSIAICAALGFERGLVEKVGVGAMMHDVGKSALPVNVLNKEGRLTNDEFSLMKTHVMEGFRILENKKEMPKEALVVVLQHHERPSGSGYPFGLSGEKVRTFGRIASIADCYDYLTTPRPYRYAYTPFMALSMMTKETKEKGDFDTDFLKTFIKIVAEHSE